MFESLLSPRERTGRFIGSGAIVSVILHLGVGGGVWALSGDHEPPEKKKKPGDVTMVQPTAPLQAPVVDLLPPPPPPPPPPPAAAEAPKVEAKIEPEKPKVEKPKPKKEPKPDTLVKPPDNPEPKAAEPTEPKPGGAETTAAAPPAGGQPGGQEGGQEGGVIGGKIGGVIGGKIGGTGTSTEVVPFGEGMARPKRLSGDDPRYSREALEAEVEGTMIVKCVIETDGRLQNCRVIKSMPHMERAVLDALGTHRYSPMTFQGRPVRVDYTFTIRLVMPR
jgi:protein TonB